MISSCISGKDDILIKDVSVFLENHPNACFLGLLYSDTCHSDQFVDIRHNKYNPRLTVCIVSLIVFLHLYRYINFLFHFR